MSTLAGWIWNPILSIIYIEIGILFLILTSAVAWRKSFKILRSVFGKDKEEKSESGKNQISHTKALLSSIAACVGVGNLAGVATAIHLGGPGALFWMWVSALVGMSFRMTSTYMALKHQPADVNAQTFATPMAYLEKYMKGTWGWIPTVVAGLIVIKGLITANLIQANSVAHALHGQFDFAHITVAVVLAFFVGIVIIGGVQKIVTISSNLAPWMVLIYVATGLVVLLSHPLVTAKALGLVFYYAFTPYSFVGGAIGYTVLQTMQFGISRGIFSHTSGIGVSPFLQAANKDHPAIGAFMAAVTPAIDTLVVCSITGLVLISGMYWKTITGAQLTVATFAAALGRPGQLIVFSCLVIFAYTTIISYAYFSEKSFLYLGGKNVMAYRWFFVIVTFIGPFFPVAFVWSLGDVVIGCLIIFHLLPLTSILLTNLRTMRFDLGISDGKKLESRK